MKKNKHTERVIKLHEELRGCSDYELHQNTDFIEDVELHRLWLESDGVEGTRIKYGGVWPGYKQGFRGHNLKKANFKGIQFRGMDLTDTNLAGADLQEADLRSTMTSNTKFHGANLDRALMLQRTYFLAEKQGASLVDVTVFPNPITPLIRPTVGRIQEPLVSGEGNSFTYTPVPLTEDQKIERMALAINPRRGNIIIQNQAPVRGGVLLLFVEVLIIVAIVATLVGGK